MALGIEWFRLILNTTLALIAMAIMIYAFRQMRKIDREREELTTALRDGPNPQMIQSSTERIQARMLVQMGLDLDLLIRIETDLAFLHTQVYDIKGGIEHSGCPTCETTVPELEAVIERVRSTRMAIERAEDLG